MRFIALPTWLITRAVIPFLSKSHPWYERKFTLQDWFDHETKECRQFDYLYWWGFIALIIGLTIWINR